MKKLTALALFSILAATSLRADLIWYEGFQYPDGSIITNTIIGLGTNSIWTRVSGTANPSDLLAANSNLQVSATGGTLSRQDDCDRLFATSPGSPYTNSVQVVYASFTVICTNLPNGPGSYFGSFYSGPVYTYTAGGRTTNFNGFGFCGRVQAFTNGTLLPRTWRLGVSDNVLATNAPDGGFPVDLALNTAYQVVEELDPISLLAASIWVNPIHINNTGDAPIDPLYTANDAINFQTTNQVNAYAFRQASTFGNSFFVITNLAVATTFAEAMTNVWTTNAFPPSIVYQPVIGITNFVAIPIAVSAVANGQGLANLTYQWQKNGANFSNPAGNNNKLPFSNPQITDSGDYRLIVTTPYGLSTTSSVCKVLISAAPVPPSFITQPVSQTVYKGQTVGFSTTVSSPGNIFYQWKSNSVNIAGANASTYTLNNVTTNFAASYSVAVTNDVVPTGIVSTNAVLTVINPAKVSIAYLRSLVDPVTYLATNTPPTIPYEVTGIVTTFTNITTGNTFSYYLQDGTGGINIFGTLGSTFRPAQGDVLTFVGVLSSFNTGLELYADPAGNYPYTSYTILSNNIAALPAPISIPYDAVNDPSNANYNLGGSLVKITDVNFGTRAGTTNSTTANDFVTVTNSAGQQFTLLFPDVDLDVAGQILPVHAYSASGVLYSANSIVTNTIVITKFSDIVLTGPISLNANFSGGSVTFTWSDAAFDLQNAANVLGPYNTIIGATSGFVTNTTTHPTMFFRLIKP